MSRKSSDSAPRSAIRIDVELDLVAAAAERLGDDPAGRRLSMLGVGQCSLMATSASLIGLLLDPVDHAIERLARHRAGASPAG